MDGLAVLAATILGALVVAAFGYGFVVSTRRVLRDDGNLRLSPMLHRYGVDLSSASDHYHAALATRRCIACSDKARCDAWLRSGKREGVESFCPNASFVQGAAARRGD